MNALISSDPDDLERLAGMANMTGVPIEVSLLAGARDERQPIAHSLGSGPS